MVRVNKSFLVVALFVGRPRGRNLRRCDGRRNTSGVCCSSGGAGV